MQKLTLSLVILITIFIAGAAPLGWVLNLIKFAELDFKAPYKAEIIRGAGVVTGIGAVTRYMKIND